MELWITENQTENMSISLRLKTVLHREQTQYQDLLVADSYQYGRVMLLDGCMMTSEAEEFVYHEMMSHVPLFTHPNPRQVLVVGGGDGGVVREILKHQTVERVVLAEIDDRVVAAARAYLPSISQALDNPRCEVMIGDGVDYVQKNPNRFDVIIVDSTDPIGPAVGLFTRDFYQSVSDALTEGGIFVAQTESPFTNAHFLAEVQRRVGAIFPITTLYTAAIPLYPTGFWSITLGSKRHDPRTVELDARWEQLRLNTKYYDPPLHRAAFTLPRFARRLSWEHQKAARAAGERLEVGLPFMGPEKTVGPEKTAGRE